MKKIYILDAFHEAGIRLAKQHAHIVRWPDPEIANWPENADGVMVRMTPVTGADLARAKKVKIICKQGVGIDTIDLEAAKRHNIPVCRTPGVNSEAVAELAFSLALSVTRRIARFDRMLRAGEKIVRPDHLGLQMEGKTVGLIGMGNISTRVAKKWIGAFGARIFAYDPYAPENAWSDIPHTRCHTLEQVLSEAHVLSLHLPLTPESRHMIGRDQLKAMKADAVIVNTSRGGIIDEKALFEVMHGGHLYGAGLDVFEQEPPSPDYPLLSLPNVVATPHAAGGTHETQERSSLQVAQQVIDVLNGQPPSNQVN
ncbi:NAD(P)-dependent oxidoreductase [Advenella kashmirensis]